MRSTGTSNNKAIGITVSNNRQTILVHKSKTDYKTNSKEKQELSVFQDI